MFEYTSKIPLEDIEKAMQEQQKETVSEMKIVSPYTTSTKKDNGKVVNIAMIIAVILIVIIAVVAIKVITVDNVTTSMISFVER